MPYPQTYKGMQDAIISRLRLTDDTPNRNRVKDWINEHNADLCLETELLQCDGAATLTADEPNFVLDATIGRIKVIVIRQASQAEFGPPLTFTSLGDIMAKRQSGQVAAVNNGVSTHYAMTGHNQIELWPTPATADELAMWFVKFPPVLSADADTFVFPGAYPKAVEYSALYDAALWQKDPDLATIERDRDIWLAKLRRHLNRHVGGFPHHFAIAGAPAVPSWDNSRDVVW